MDKLEVNIPPIVLILISILSFFGVELPQFILNIIDPSPVLL